MINVDMHEKENGVLHVGLHISGDYYNALSEVLLIVNQLARLNPEGKSSGVEVLTDLMTKQNRLNYERKGDSAQNDAEALYFIDRDEERMN